MKNKYLLLALCGLILSFSFACKDEEKETCMSIESIQGNASADLSGRDNWVMTLSNKPYQYIQEGDSIYSAYPLEEAHCQKYISYPNFKPAGNFYVRLISPTYYPSSESTVPAIQNQTTKERMKNADALSCSYMGTLDKNTTGVDLIHANALLGFQLVDFPEDSQIEVSISQNVVGTIRPFNPSPLVYWAVALAEGGDYYANISIRIDGISYNVPLTDTSKFEYINKNTFYKFEVVYSETRDASTGELKNVISIEELETSEWSEMELDEVIL